MQELPDAMTVYLRMHVSLTLRVNIAVTPPPLPTKALLLMRQFPRQHDADEWDILPIALEAEKKRCANQSASTFFFYLIGYAASCLLLDKVGIFPGKIYAKQQFQMECSPFTFSVL